jgi:hypothetical protein
VTTLIPREEWATIAPSDAFLETAREVWGCVFDIDPAYAQ